MSIVDEVNNIIKENQFHLTENNMFENAIRNYNRMIDEKILKPKQEMLYPINKSYEFELRYNSIQANFMNSL